MIDRGAELSWLSQYPHEQEVLFPPLLGVEVLDTAVEGNLLLVDARLSLNLLSLTLEQVRGKRAKLIRDWAETLLGETRSRLHEAPSGCDSIMQFSVADLERRLKDVSCADTELPRSDAADDRFNDDVIFTTA
eukprot:3926028-Prymnesium_polylepis.1